MRGDELKPRARRSGLIIRDLPGEVVVYDLETHRAHCLNRTAALVFRSADGRRTVSGLAALVAADSQPEAGDRGPYGTHSGHEEAEDVVQAALERLGEAHLLEAPALPSSEGATSRREALRRVGLGAAALVPVVASILVPTPAEAGNTCIPASACTGNTLQPCYVNVGQKDVECLTLKCHGAGAGNCY